MPPVGRKGERRRDERFQVKIEGRFRIAGGWRRCRLEDVSRSGARVSSEARPPLGHDVVLDVVPDTPVAGTVKRHTDDGFVVEFLPPSAA